MTFTAICLECSLRSTAVLALGWGIAWVLRGQAAALRHLVWVVLLVVVALTPVMLPVGLRVVPQVATFSRSSVATSSAREELIITAKSVNSARRGFPAALVLWLGGALLIAIRAGKSVRHVRALRKDAIEIDAADIAAAVELPCTQFTGVRMLLSDSVAIALTSGVRAPCIFLPSSFRAWSASRLRAVLLHELAHVRRRDCAWQWMAQVVCAAYWFHPLVWLARDRMLCESERACDDAVVRAGANATDFARDLLEIAQSLSPKGVFPMASSLTSKLERRIARLLSPTANRSAITPLRAAIATTCVLALSVPLAILRAQQTARPPVVPPFPMLVAQAPIPRPPAQRPVQRPVPQTPAPASLTGVVYDQTGAVIQGASVTIADSARTLVTRTDDDGVWSFGSLPPGSYNLEVAKTGFAKAQRGEIHVPPFASDQLDITLNLGSASESVTVAADRLPAQSAPVPPAPRRVGGRVIEPLLTRKVAPVYPASARQQGLEGAVVIQAVIGTSGNVLDANSIDPSTPPELARAALDAVRQWQYQPTILNGQPVDTMTTITIRFVLSPQ